MTIENIENVEFNRYWALEHNVARSFNRLKAKIYNLVEASVSDKTQQEALKGLVKGFANDEYRLCVDEMRFIAMEMKLIDEEDRKLPAPAQPLESRVF